MKLFCPLFHYYLDKVIYSNEKERKKRENKEEIKEEMQQSSSFTLINFGKFSLHCFRVKSVRHIGCNSRFKHKFLF